MVLLLVIAGVVAGFVSLVPEPVQAPGGPTILSTSWTQKYPQEPERIEVMSEVVPLPGTTIALVSVTYCTVPVGVCTYHNMAYTGSGNAWNVTLDMYPSATGAKVLAYAYDNASRLSTGVNMTMYYARTLVLDASLTPGTAPQGTPVILDGQLLYNGNTSSPAESSPVSVLLDNAPFWSATTDDQGRFSLTMTAPTLLGLHTLAITATNRSLTQTQTYELYVTATPEPDFQATSVAPATPLAKEGETVTLEATVTNVGTLAGTGTATLFLDGTSVHTETFTLLPGEMRNLTADWTAVGGEHQLNFVVTATGDTSTGNDQRTVTVAVTRPSSPDPPYVLIGLALVGVLAAILIGAFVLRSRRGA